MLVFVTDDHIERGVPKSAENCALALAVQEETGQDDWIVVCGQISRDMGMEFYLMREPLVDWVARMDAGSPVAPISFMFAPNGRGHSVD